jgi:hypothetical protein
VVNADKVAVIIGGRDFKAAFLPVAIMAFFPLHQTYGQLSTAVFFATDQTRLYSYVMSIFLLLGLPVTYFLLAPAAFHGFGMGAIGLTIKMLAMNIIATNALLYFNAKLLHLPFGWYLSHQVVSVAVFMALAFLATWGADHWMAGADVIWRFLGAGLGYLFVMTGFVYFFPGLLGLGHQDISVAVARVLPGVGK